MDYAQAAVLLAKQALRTPQNLTFSPEPKEDEPQARDCDSAFRDPRYRFQLERAELVHNLVNTGGS